MFELVSPRVTDSLEPVEFNMVSEIALSEAVETLSFTSLPTGPIHA